MHALFKLELCNELSGNGPQSIQGVDSRGTHPLKLRLFETSGCRNCLASQTSGNSSFMERGSNIGIGLRPLRPCGCRLPMPAWSGDQVRYRSNKAVASTEADKASHEHSDHGRSIKQAVQARSCSPTSRRWSFLRRCLLPSSIGASCIERYGSTDKRNSQMQYDKQRHRGNN